MSAKSWKTGSRLLAAFFFAACAVRPTLADVVINEIMYHPASQNEDEEWVEIYNAGPTTETLTGWQFLGAITYTFPSGKTIGPGRYVVIAKSVAAFQALYTTSTADLIGGYFGRLNNAGDQLYLYDQTVALVDMVPYDDEGYWPEASDGDGPSLELVNPHLDNALPQSWGAGIAGGTPGLPNSRFVADPAPILMQPRHWPAVPGTADAIAITVRAYDDSAVTAVSLFYKEDESTGPFSTVPMLDDGASSDGAAGDGVYGALLPPQPQGTILEFWMRASDDSAQTTDFPMTAPTENCLLQVDNEDFSAFTPVYRIVMKAADDALLHTRDPWSNELLNATFIYGNEIYYNVGVRFRGKGSRNSNRIRKSYRVQFRKQEPFGQIENLNLNAQFTRCQYIDMDLCRRAGVPAPETKFAYLVFKFHDVNSHLPYYGNSDPDLYNLPPMGWRLQVEDINKRFLHKWFPGNSNGNLYRGYYYSSTRQADLTYRGPDKNLYRAPYEKKTNKEADDYSDVITLCDVFTNTPDASFTQVIQDYIDVDEWWRYWSCMTMINIEETQIYNTRGDDYFLYFNPATSPPLIKAQLLPWDLDEANLNPTKTIFSCTLPRVRRFVENPDFTPKYFRNIQDLLDNYYTTETMIPQIQSLAPYGGFEVAPTHRRDTVPIAELISYVHNRIAYLESVISRKLVVNVPGTVKVADEYLSLSPTVNLNGRGVTAWTRWVTVDGNDAGYQHLTGDWGDYPVTLSPGLNTYVVECLTTAGVAISTETVHIRYVTTSNTLCGTLPANMTLTAAASPYYITCDVIVPDGITLTVEPGTLVMLDPGTSIYVFGTLLAVGTETEPIIFAAASTGGAEQSLISAGATWRYDDTGTDRGTAWRAIAYDDGAWPSGPAQLGYGDGDEATVLTRGPNSSTRYPCYYFRRRFQVFDPALFSSLELQVVRDDGCVIYLNGTEVARDSMPAGTITYNTWASVLASGSTGENAWHTMPAPDPGLLLAGTNVVAVEVHQYNSTSSDVSFDLKLSGVQAGAHWGVIALDGADAVCQLVHCDFSGGSSGGYNAQSYGGMVSVRNSTVEAIDCRFSDHGADALEVTGGGVATVRRCDFAASENTAVRAVGGSVVIEDSTFQPRSQATARAVYLSGQASPAPLVRGNEFQGGPADLVVLENSNTTIESNVIHSAGDAGLQIGSAGRPLVDYNVIYDCGRGIVVRNGATATVDHNTLYGNAKGIECREEPVAPGSGGGTATVTNTIVWAGPVSIAVDGLSTVNVTYSDVQGGFPGSGNFDLDPQFIDAGQHNFHIQATSPCAAGGEGGTYVGAFPAFSGLAGARHWEWY